MANAPQAPRMGEEVIRSGFEEGGGAGSQFKLSWLAISTQGKAGERTAEVYCNGSQGLRAAGDLVTRLKRG